MDELQERIKKVGCLVTLKDSIKAIGVTTTHYILPDSIDEVKRLISKDVNAEMPNTLLVQWIARLESEIENFNNIVEECIDAGLFSHESLESYMIKDKEEK